jgi:hypothetical protein
MRPEENVNELIRKMHLKASTDLDKRVHEDISRGPAQYEQLKSAGAQPNIWRRIMKTKRARFTIAAVAAFVVIGGFTFWPGRGADGKQWWLAPPAVWSQEIVNALDTFKCVTCREQLIALEPDGSESTWAWMKRYTTNDRYRKDWYNKGFLEEIQWYVPDGSDMVQHSVRFDSKSYSTKIHTGTRSSGKSDPVEGLRICVVEDLDNADRLLGTKVIEGSECVGFEIDTEDGMTDRIWFDVKTKLPARIEHRNLPKSPGSDKRITIIRDQYDYDPGLPPETFVPYIPEGFVPYQPGESQIDIAITDEDLTVTGQPDGSFKVEIAIYNNGPDPFPKFKVEFYAGDPDKGGRFLASQAAGPIMPGDYGLSNHPGLKLRTNEKTIFVVVNPRNRFPELNETNNKASRVVPGRISKRSEVL